MRSTSFLLAVGPALLLAGCACLQPPPPVPEWAMYRTPLATKPSAHREKIVQRRSLAATPQEESRPVSFGLAGRDANVSSEAPLPFTPAWYERQTAIDEHLRRVMKICRDC